MCRCVPQWRLLLVPTCLEMTNIIFLRGWLRLMLVRTTSRLARNILTKQAAIDLLCRLRLFTSAAHVRRNSNVAELGADTNVSPFRYSFHTFLTSCRPTQRYTHRVQDARRLFVGLQLIDLLHLQLAAFSHPKLMRRIMHRRRKYSLKAYLGFAQAVKVLQQNAQFGMLTPI